MYNKHNVVFVNVKRVHHGHNSSEFVCQNKHFNYFFVFYFMDDRFITKVALVTWIRLPSLKPIILKRCPSVTFKSFDKNYLF